MLVTGLLFILCGRTLKPGFSSPFRMDEAGWVVAEAVERQNGVK